MKHVAAAVLSIPVALLAPVAILAEEPARDTPRTEALLEDLARSVRDLVALERERDGRGTAVLDLQRAQLAVAVLDLRTRKIEALELALADVRKTADEASTERGLLQEEIDRLEREVRDATAPGPPKGPASDLPRLETLLQSLMGRIVSADSRRAEIEGQLADARRSVRGLEAVIDTWLATLEPGGVR